MKYTCCRRENVSLKGGGKDVEKENPQEGYLAEIFSEIPAELLSSRVFLETL